MTPPATTRYSSDLSTIPFVCCSLSKPVHSIMAFTHGIFFVFLCCAGPLCEVRALASTYIVSSNTELSKALAATVKGGDKLIINVENNDEKARKMSAVVCGGSKCCYFLSKQLEVSQGTVEINGNGEGCILAAHGHSRIFSVKSGTLIVNDITLKHGRQDMGQYTSEARGQILEAETLCLRTTPFPLLEALPTSVPFLFSNVIFASF